MLMISPSQDSTQLEDQLLSKYVTPGFKPFLIKVTLKVIPAPIDTFGSFRGTG